MRRTLDKALWHIYYIVIGPLPTTTKKKYKEALDDANQAIQLSPDWSKGYLRKGHALAALGQKAESEAAFAKMKELEGSQQQK